MDSMDAQQELSFIRKVIEDGRRAISDDGKELIVWGLLVVVGMATMFVSLQFEFAISKVWLWGALIGIGWTYTIVREIRTRKRNRFTTFGGRILGSLWMGCGIVMTLVGFLAPATGAIKPWAIIPIISLILGIGYLVTGVVHDDRWMRMSAAGWWVGAVVMLLWPGYYMFLLFGGLIIVFQIVPGVKLYREWQAQHSSE